MNFRSATDLILDLNHQILRLEKALAEGTPRITDMIAEAYSEIARLEAQNDALRDELRELRPHATQNT